MLTKIRKITLVRCSIFSIIFLSLSILTWQNTYLTKFIRVNVPVSNIEQLKALAGLNVLLISDLHIGNEKRSLDRWHRLLDEIIATEVDYIFIAGDFIGDIADLAEIDRIRSKFIESLEQIDKPFAMVLGNHETWTGRQDWLDSFRAADLPVLENETTVLKGDSPICVIGVGDSYSGFSRKVEVPQGCAVLPQIFLTHDPQAAFENTENGVWLAGHTHCGQIRLPFIGAPWIPSSSPKEAHCGLYEDDNKIVFTSSGVGNSLLPIRFLAQSQMELLSFE
jgi:uncharacterized protein